MSIRDGVEPSPSKDSETHTQPIPGNGIAADNESSAEQGDRPTHPTTPAAPPPRPADEAWPPSWGESPSWGQGPGSPDDPAWTRPSPSPADPAWTRPSPSSADRGWPQPAPADPNWAQPAAQADAPTWTEPPGAKGPSWTLAPGAAAAAATPAPGSGPAGTAQGSAPGATTQTIQAEAPRTDAASWTQTQTGPAQGGGHPTAPTWGTRPADGGRPGGRGPSRWLAAVVAGVVLLAGGYGISQVLDKNDATPTGAGIPTAAPAAGAPAPSSSSSSEEPAAAVAKALLPTVVELRHGNGLGSGFVYDKNGFIMTAAHVVEGTDQVDVRLYDGTQLTGNVVGRDELNDVAVVKINHSGLAAAPLALGETVQVGQLAVAIGSPFGLNETVTAGIISATDRNLNGREVIQTDAPINPGNSGGVLADRRGRVIGINDAIQTGSDSSNGNVGIGFAIPIDLAAKSATAIVQGKQVQVGYLGVNMAPPASGQDGALVQEVVPGSPADKAGLRAGDLVVGIDGQSVADYGELGARIRGHKPGDKVALKVVRGGNETTITATLTQRPAG
jgi:putative serine protease PepD